MKTLNLTLAVMTLCVAFTSFSFADDSTKKASDLAPECKADIEKFCKDIKPGGNRIAHCLRHNQKNISPDCASALNSKHPHAATQGANGTD